MVCQILLGRRHLFRGANAVRGLLKHIVDEVVSQGGDCTGNSVSEPSFAVFTGWLKGLKNAILLDPIPPSVDGPFTHCYYS